MSNFVEGFLESPLISLEPFEAINYGSIVDETCLQSLLSLIREHTIRLVKISPKCLSNLNKLQIVGLLRLPRDVVVTLKLMHSVIPDLGDHAVLQNLITLMKNEKLGIPVSEKVVKNSVIFGPRIEKCFTGTEAVDWFITHVSQFSSFQIDRRRPMAVEFGSRLLHMQILSTVGSSSTFRDNGSLYKFTEKKSQNVLNSTILWGPSRAKPLEDVYDMLSRIMNLYDSHVSYYGEITKEALFCIKNTSKYREFCLLTSKLQQVNLNEFGENERLCFFINVYNTLNLHATVDAAEEFKLNRPLTFFQQACYDIGGQLYSLDDIEHGIIRGNSAATQLMGNISTSLKKIDRRDPRFPFVIKSPTAFVNFVLWSGYKSGPRVRIYHAESILLEMLEAAKEYIGGHFQFDPAKYEVTLPKIIDYNQQDFGGSRAAIVAWLKGNNVLCKSHVLFLTASWCARSDHSVTFDHFYTSFQYHTSPDYVLNTIDVSNYGWAMARRLRPVENNDFRPLPTNSPPATE